MLILSIWCGLAGGLLEVGARFACWNIFPNGRMNGMSRHFLWLAPLSNLMLFSAVGSFLALATKLWQRFGEWFSPRFIGCLAMLPVLIVAAPRIYPQAWAILTFGISSCLVPILERHAAGLRRSLLLSFPGLLGVVLLAAGFIFGGDWIEQRREAASAIPPTDSPNVLLIVLDTVRADHLSLYGYERGTSPTLARLAKRGIVFEQARASAALDSPLACNHVYGSLASRARRQLASAAPRKLPDAG